MKKRTLSPSDAIPSGQPDPSVEAPTTRPLASSELTLRYAEVRAASEALAAPLSPEDQSLQSVEFASPTKWHLAHTTWYFETFVLASCQDGYAPFHPRFGFLFNSYYHTVGAMHARADRGPLLCLQSVEPSSMRQGLGEDHARPSSWARRGGLDCGR